MKNCPNCHHQAKDEALFCPVCGTTLDAFIQPDADYFRPQQPAQPVPAYIPPEPVIPAYDHTGDYAAEDIRYGKLLCMAVYLLDFIGIIIALLMGGPSEYTRFHIRQSLKFSVLEALIILISLLLCWTIVVPVIGLIVLVALIVVKLSCFLDVCKGKAKDATIVRSIKFLN